MSLDKFKVWCPDYSQTINDASGFEALDHQDAAEMWAAKADQDSAEYSIASGSPAQVMVMDGSGNRLRFFVVGESVPAYTAHQE